MTPDPGACAERELTAPVALCTDGGTLAKDAVGWARHPLIDCTLHGSWGRRKRWDFWCVTGPGFAMNLTFADVDYLGLADVWFRDFDRAVDATATVPVPFALGMSTLARRPGQAALATGGRKLRLAMTDEAGSARLAMTDEAGGTRLTVAFDTKLGPFAADVLVTAPDGHESLTVVIPWGQRRFQCTTKDVARRAVGMITWGDHRYDLADDGSSWGCLDFGRGKWPYRTMWNWGAAAGLVGDRPVGLQLGGKWTDGTGMTENALVVDGRLSKLSDELVWEYDTTHWLRPWRIRTQRSDRLDVTFTPIYDKVSRLRAGVAASIVDQCFGTYRGTIVPDDGAAIEVVDLFGWAEEASWRW